MIDDGPLQTSETGPRSRSKPSWWIASAIWVVCDWPTGIGSQGTVLTARQTPPPSWSVAASSRWRSTPRTAEMKAFIASGPDAFWFRFTTSRPPNWRCRQSASTASVAAPWKPTMITAPTSSASVSPPGPSRAARLAIGDGEAAGEGEADGGRLAGPPQATRSSPTRTAAAVLGIALRQLPAQPGLDEDVDVAILEHGLHVADLDAGPHVLDQRVGLQGVVADLGAELGRQHLAFQVVDLLRGQHLLALEEAGPEHLHGDLAVLDLGALVLAGDDDAARDVRDPDRRLGLVDVLAAGAAGAVGVDPDVVGVDLDHGLLLLQLGQHLDQREGGVTAVVLVEGRDPHQPVDAVLGAQQPVGARALDQQRHPLDAGLVAGREVEHLGLEAVPFRPGGVHPHQHLRPVLGVHATGSGADGDHGVVGRVGIGEEQLQLPAGELGRDLVRLPQQLVRQLGVLERGELEQVPGAS